MSASRSYKKSHVLIKTSVAKLDLKDIEVLMNTTVVSLFRSEKQTSMEKNAFGKLEEHDRSISEA